VGTEGTLYIHDPNNFNGPITVKKPFNDEPLIIPYSHSFTENGLRGIGVADMAYAIRNKRKPRVNADIGLHAFEVIHKVWESTSTGKTYTIKNQAERPIAMPQTMLSAQCAEGTMDHS
jgi:predicted dehydrogenase